MAVSISARSAAQRRVWRSLGELSEAHKEILVLRDYQDLPYREISEVLKIPQGTVMSRLFYARKKLQKLLADER